VPDDEEIPELEARLPFEIAVGRISMIHQGWWDANPDALTEAMNVAEWLDFHIERRNVGETIPARPVQRLTLTVGEAAQALGISRAFAYESVAKGEIPCIRIGKRILIPKIALDKMLEGAAEAGQDS
jgi:excisionase family DNA binding protein